MISNFVPAYFHDAFLIVYRPAQAFGNLLPIDVRFAGTRLFGLYGLLALAALSVNYFRLTDLNDRRRLRVLLIGGAAAVLPGAFRLLIWRSASLSGIWSWLSSGVANILLAVIFVLFPASFAYSILRHRLLDIRLIIRQGVQYAEARGALLSVVPLLGVLLLADLVVHGDQPLIGILEARGWVYLVLATVAAGAHAQRRRWGDAIDRRFFRERCDARRLLREVAAESGRGRSFAGALHRFWTLHDHVFLTMKPPLSILDRRFNYTSAAHTDVAATFRRHGWVGPEEVRREMQRSQDEQLPMFLREQAE